MRQDGLVQSDTITNRLSRLAGAVVFVTAVTATAGCTVPSGGAIALGLDTGSQPIAYVQMCEGGIDGLTVYEDTGHGTSRTMGEWDAPRRVGTSATVPLAAPPADWTVERPLTGLDPATSYHVYGWTNDNSGSANGPDFTLDDLAALEPGQVTWWNGDWGTDGNHPTNAVTTLAEFQDQACDD